MFTYIVSQNLSKSVYNVAIWKTNWALFLRLEPISQLRFGYDTNTIRRYHDAFDYDESDRNYDLRSIRLRYDYTTKN